MVIAGEVSEYSLMHGCCAWCVQNVKVQHCSLPPQDFDDGASTPTLSRPHTPSRDAQLAKQRAQLMQQQQQLLQQAANGMLGSGGGAGSRVNSPGALDGGMMDEGAMLTQMQQQLAQLQLGQQQHQQLMQTQQRLLAQQQQQQQYGGSPTLQPNAMMTEPTLAAYSGSPGSPGGGGGGFPGQQQQQQQQQQWRDPMSLGAGQMSVMMDGPGHRRASPFGLLQVRWGSRGCFQFILGPAHTAWTELVGSV